jgi:hypothetical protein
MSTEITPSNQNIEIVVTNDVIDINVTTTVVDVNTTTEIITIEAAGTYPLPATVYSVFGRTGAIVATLGDYNTSLVTESTNLYFTNARARSAISLTTLGTSGPATYNSSTGVFNIPQYQGGVTSFNTRTGAITLLSADVTDALGFTPYSNTNPSGFISGITSGMVTTALGFTPVTNSRTLTINGTTYDLTADRSWTIATGSGTVTSVGLSAPTGFSVTNSPITTSGTLALGFSAGYSLPTDASQSTWNTAYNRSLLSAAVTGTTTKTLTLNQQDGGTITASWTDINTDAVTSVFGRTGAVVAANGDYTTSQVTEGTNLYYTDARSRAALSAGTGINYNNTTGVITNSAPDQTVSLTSGTGISVSGTYPSFTIASTITQYTDALARASLSFTSGSGAYNSTTGVITIPTNTNELTNGAGFITSSSLSGYVPYTGATANLDLGTFDLTTDIVNLNQLKAIGSGGINIYSNSGTHIALMGGGGGAGTTLYGGLIGTSASFTTNGGSDTFAINHSSGSGIALNITKGGNGEGIYINKTSGSGNAATIIGTLNATTLVKSGGTSSQFLKADGSVDASAYITLTSLSGSTGISYNNTTGAISSTITQYTDALARASISLTTTGTSGAATYNSTTGVLNIPQYSGGGGGGMAIGGSITSATAGSVLFAGASGVLAQDNANFFWDDTNNRLGLGTASPTARLQVTGSTTASSGFGLSTVINPTLVAAANNDKLIALDVTGTFTTGGFTGTSSLVARFNGNVIMGTIPSVISSFTYVPLTLSNSAFAATKVQLALVNGGGGGGAASAIDFFTYTDAGNGLPGVRIIAVDDGNYSGDYQIQTKAQGSVGAGALSTKFVIIGGSGNIGIGTTTVGSKLQVNGNAAIGYSASTAAPSNGLAVSGSVLINTTSTTGTFAPTLLIRQNSTNYAFEIKTTSAKTSTTLNKFMALSSSDATSPQYLEIGIVGAATNSNRYFSFQTSEFLIADSGNIVFQPRGGNVGIGATTIGSKLQVNGNAAIGYSASTAAPTNGMSVAGTVNVGTNTSVTTAALQVSSTTQGFLPPVMTTTQKNAISSPATGLVVFDSTLGKLCVFSGTWQTITSL